MATEKIEEKAVISEESEKATTVDNIVVEKGKINAEQGVEQKLEKTQSVKENISTDKKEKIIRDENEVSPVNSSQASAYYQTRAKAIDNILSAGLHEVFLQMKPDKQKEFKTVGEETVVMISTLLDKSKVKVDKIISLIRNWLKLIPGVNKFFLEQEAKIKADQIIKLKNN